MRHNSVEVDLALFTKGMLVKIEVRVEEGKDQPILTTWRIEVDDVQYHNRGPSAATLNVSIRELKRKVGNHYQKVVEHPYFENLYIEEILPTNGLTLHFVSKYEGIVSVCYLLPPGALA
jgi:hypothetical protein